jgi:hypothetical protein
MMMLRDHRTDGQPVVSRRTALTATGAGVTVLIAGVSGVAAATDATHRAPDTKRRTLDGPLVVQVRDVASGTLDVFVGTRRVQVRDSELAARLVDAALDGK